MRAAAYYRHLIPLELVAPEQYAYFFDRNEEDLDAFEEPITEINRLMAMWKSGQVERRARLGTNFVELLRADDGGRSRHVLRDLDALVFVVADSVTSVKQLHGWFGTVAQRDDILAAIARLVCAGALVQSGDRVVACIAYAEPHTDAELRACDRRIADRHR